MDYRKKTKICLDQPTVGNQADTAKATVGVSARSEMVAPNTGIGGGVEFYLLALVLMVVVLAIAVYLAKKGKIVFFALALMIGLTGANFAAKTNRAFAEATDIANCQNIGYSEYDVVFRLFKQIFDGRDANGLPILKDVVMEELVFPGTGSRQKDLELYYEKMSLFDEVMLKEVQDNGYAMYWTEEPIEPDEDSEDQIFNIKASFAF